MNKKGKQILEVTTISLIVTIGMGFSFGIYWIASSYDIIECLFCGAMTYLLVCGFISTARALLEHSDGKLRFGRRIRKRRGNARYERMWYLEVGKEDAKND